MKKILRHSRKGFTLVELLIAMTIFAIMSTMTVLIYFNISETSRRMQIAREISESARQVTERISEEIKKNGLNIKNIDAVTTAFARQTTPMFSVGHDTNGEPTKTFYLAKEGGTRACDYNETSNNDVNCSLYIWENNEAYNLIDVFKEEKTKRVRITDLKFYLTGDDNEKKKLTLNMTLELAPKVWVPNSLIRTSKMKIQTTFSERITQN